MTRKRVASWSKQAYQLLVESISEENNPKWSTKGSED